MQLACFMTNDIQLAIIVRHYTIHLHYWMMKNMQTMKNRTSLGIHYNNNSQPFVIEMGFQLVASWFVNL